MMSQIKGNCDTVTCNAAAVT